MPRHEDAEEADPRQAFREAIAPTGQSLDSLLEQLLQELHETEGVAYRDKVQAAKFALTYKLMLEQTHGPGGTPVSWEDIVKRLNEAE